MELMGHGVSFLTKWCFFSFLVVTQNQVKIQNHSEDCFERGGIEEGRAKEHWAQHEYDTRHEEIYFGESNMVKVSQVDFTLLQNATDITTKCGLYYKIRQYNVSYQRFLFETNLSYFKNK